MNTYFKNLIENNKKINNVEEKLNSNNDDENKKIKNIKFNDNNKEPKSNNFLKIFEDFIFT